METPVPIVHIEVETEYLESLSQPEENKYLFSYTITIYNKSEIPLTLQRRYWLITDGDGNTHEVEGEGVVGETPTIGVNERYQYTSGMVLETPLGCMQGHYELAASDEDIFQAIIPAFSLYVPGILH